MTDCCGRRFYGHKSIRNHLDNSAAHGNEIECHSCYRRWPTHAGKARLHHEQQEHWLKCEESGCSYIFKNQESLDEHVDEEHPPNYCYGCQRRFDSAHSLNQHLKSSVHVGKNVKCPWCTSMYTNLTGVCHHLESGNCASGINRKKIDEYCRQVDRNHIFTNRQIEWHGEVANNTSEIATAAAWDGDYYRCYFCDEGFDRLPPLNQHLASPAHQRKIYHCPRCNREYTALSGLVNHLESESCGAFRFSGNASGFGFVNQLRLGN